jgi:ATP-dependent DNA helicase RecG
VIERDRIVTENWSLPKNPGRIDPKSFTPYPKNPLLANFFLQIGRADALGSGVRNLYKFTKIYSGGEPELIDGDVFKTTVPLGLSLIGTSGNGKTSDKMSDKQKVSDKSHSEVLTAYLEQHGEINAQTAAQILDRAPGTARRILGDMVTAGILIAEGGNRNRVYKLTVR